MVISVTFSPDGALLASGSEDRTVRLWETATGAARAVIPAHEDSVTSVAFSPDGELLASGSRAGTVQIWDHDTVTRTVKLGSDIASLSWHGDRLGVAIERSTVVLRITLTPT